MAENNTKHGNALGIWSAWPKTLTWCIFLGWAFGGIGSKQRPNKGKTGKIKQNNSRGGQSRAIKILRRNNNYNIFLKEKILW